LPAGALVDRWDRKRVMIAVDAARCVAFASVAVALALDLDADGVVQRARVGLGGVAATPLRARATEQFLTGRPWTADTARAAGEVTAGEGTPLDDHRASAAYRTAMLRQALPALHARSRTPEEVGA
jgi:xanthine dehydrogenase small subunit